MQSWISVRNIGAASLALLLFIYPILVLSTASIRYTETIHRVTTSQTFDETLFGSGLADSLAALGFSLLFASLVFRFRPVKLASIAIFAAGVALYVAGSDLLLAVGIATLPALVGSLIVSRFAAKKKEAGRSVRFQLDATRVAGAFLLIIIILEIGAAARWITYPFFPTEMYGDPSWRFAALESALFQSLGLLSPFLVVLIAFSFFYKWFIRDVFTKIAHTMQSHRDTDQATPRPIEQSSKSREDSEFRSVPGADAMSAREAGSDAPVVATFAPKTTSITRQGHWIILSAALVIAPLLMMYPHLPGVNPQGSGVSTDEQYYMNWMSKLRADGGATWTDTIASTFTINRGDRPLTLLLILTVANTTGSPDLMVVRYLPVALAPILVLANYVLIRYSLRSKDGARIKTFASIGAMFAVFSPQIVVGEYAGFLANWLALIVAYFSIHFLIKGWESQNRNQSICSFGILFGLLLVMMLIHLYTWAHLLTVLLLFGGISYIFARKSIADPKIKILVLLLVVGTSFAIDYARSSYFSTPAAAESDSALASNILPQDTSARWDRLIFTLSSYVGGFLSNPVLFLLGLVWLVRADFSKGFERLMLAMFFILALPVAVGSVEFQTRVLYNIPFHIPALLAIYGTNLKGRNSGVLLIIAVALTLATFALRAMANLYLELPEGYVLEEQFLLP